MKPRGLGKLVINLTGTIMVWKESWKVRKIGHVSTEWQSLWKRGENDVLNEIRMKKTNRQCLTTSIGNKSEILGEALDSCFVNIWIKVRSRNKSEILREVQDSCFVNICIKVRC